MKKQIDINGVIEAYQKGGQIASICQKYGISRQTLYNLLKSKECTLRRHKLYETDACPLFDRDIYNQIYCTDCGEWEHLNLAFKDKKSKNKYKLQYCMGGKYTRCRIYAVMLDALK